MSVVTKQEPHLCRMMIQKIPENQISYTKQLIVLFIDKETEEFKLAIPLYQGLDEQKSQMSEMMKATHRSSFINITRDFNMEQLMDNMFEIIYEVDTRKVVGMLQISNPNTDCMDYFYQNLDSIGCSYQKKRL